MISLTGRNSRWKLSSIYSPKAMWKILLHQWSIDKKEFLNFCIPVASASEVLPICANEVNALYVRVCNIHLWHAIHRISFSVQWLSNIVPEHYVKNSWVQTSVLIIQVSSYYPICFALACDSLGMSNGSGPGNAGRPSRSQILAGPAGPRCPSRNSGSARDPADPARPGYF